MPVKVKARERVSEDKVSTPVDTLGVSKVIGDAREEECAETCDRYSAVSEAQCEKTRNEKPLLNLEQRESTERENPFQLDEFDEASG